MLLLYHILNYKFTDFHPNQCYPLFMRPTKSKEQLAYYKHLLAIDKKRNELANRKDDEDNYIEIPRMLIGYKIKLVPIDSLKNRNDGLAEAVAASTSWFRFSDKPFRLCNLKSYRCEFRNMTNAEILFTSIILTSQELMSVNMKKNYFGTVFIFLMAKLYLRRRNLIIGSITKENANSGIMKDGKQAAIANGNEMYSTNKLELKQKLNCQKLSMNILRQNSLARYFI